MPNFIGEKSGDIFRRGKTITLSGTVQAMSIGALERGAEFFNRCLQKQSQENLFGLDGLMEFKFIILLELIKI
jgi:hypothetical protein